MQHILVLSISLDITINRSKPEKDPRDIAAAKLQKKSAYPQCQLCVENMGFAGHQTHPARQNLRPVKLNINSQDWFMQYSPYGYYNEHCIVFNQQHIPMTINAQVFNKLFDFVEQFPHYFIGSNADLIFGRNNTSMGIVWLCLGSTFLCPAPLYLKKNKENDE